MFRLWKGIFVKWFIIGTMVINNQHGKSDFAIFICFQHFFFNVFISSVFPLVIWLPITNNKRITTNDCTTI
jgi:hypothetical protein